MNRGGAGKLKGRRNRRRYIRGRRALHDWRYSTRLEIKSDVEQFLICMAEVSALFDDLDKAVKRS